MAEVGLATIQARTYELDGAAVTASPARFFYSYHPATTESDTAPLFVLTGGGPGAAVMFLLGFTGPYTITEPQETPSVATNSQAWTDLAHLLYIDARNAGLSYATLDDPSDTTERQAEFTLRNYNVYEDAADVLSALFTFLDAHPGLASHPVYVVSESYGGVRATVMLSFLLDHAEYAARRRPFHSQELSDRISRYLKQQLVADASPEEVATRWAGQILLQPLLAGARQDRAAGALFEQPRVHHRPARRGPGSLVRALRRTAPAVRSVRQCTEAARPARPQSLRQSCRRGVAGASSGDGKPDRYQSGRARLADWSHTGAARRALLRGPRQPISFRQSGLRNRRAARPGRRRVGQALQPWDAYFAALNTEALNGFYSRSARDAALDPRADGYGELFLRNVRLVPTMVTRAEYDLEIFGPAVPVALESYPEVARITEMTAVERLAIAYADGTERTIFSPWYHQSSHAVARDQPEKLHGDIATFLTHH